MGSGKIYEHRQETWVFTWFYHVLPWNHGMFLMFLDIFPLNRQGVGFPASSILVICSDHPPALREHGEQRHHRVATLVHQGAGHGRAGGPRKPMWFPTFFSYSLAFFLGRDRCITGRISSNFWTKPGFSRAFGNGYVGHLGLFGGPRVLPTCNGWGGPPRVVLVV